MKRSQRWWMCGAATLALAAACGDDAEDRRDRFESQSPAALEDALLYVTEPYTDEPAAVIVDLASRSTRVTRLELPAGDTTLVTRPGTDGHEALVLTSGREAYIEDGDSFDAVSSHVLVVDRDGERARYPLGGRFTSLVVSGDGRFAVAFAPPSDSLSAANTIAVIDLSTEPGKPGATRNVSLRPGVSPSTFIFAPDQRSGRRLLVVPTPNALSLLDLDHLDRGEQTVFLSLSGDTVRTAQEVLFEGDQIYVRTTDADDVLVLQLTDDPTSKHGYAISPLQIATTFPVQDIELTGKGEAQRVVAVGFGRVALIDPISGNSAEIEPSTDFSSMLEFEARSPFDDEVRPRGLLYAPGQSVVSFLDLDPGLGWEDQDVEVVQLSDALSALIPLLSRNLAIGLHESGLLSVIDLEERSVSTFNTPEVPTSTLLDEPRSRLWLTTEVGTVGSIDLTTLEPSQLLLNAKARSVLAVPGDVPHVAVLHRGESGHVTVLDATKPSRDTARELVGFLWNRLFD